ncbi:Maf family protein [Roseitranquillus sediminis]|uniref:Maf family protein n=1 Tax=Roseitranquillus sediminis TaxID=2809051 RepID=UPI001D0C1559|nr:nucleoside triphosphate pyrophosphatase [Roseitranquillus sediminis]MBM9596229.1 septum formation protein Maf [Roseitranquillus sediminis]
MQMSPVILASGSVARARLLRDAGVQFEVERPRVDEEAIRRSLSAGGTSPRDIADALAEAKALKVTSRRPDALVVGSDQLLEFNGALLSKPRHPKDALAQLHALAGGRHTLYTAAVVCEAGTPVWRYVSEVRLQMRPASEAYLASYVERLWDEIRDCVGCYRIEGEGVRLFDRIDGDLFAVQGLPLIQLLSWLSLRGSLPA